MASVERTPGRLLLVPRSAALLWAEHPWAGTPADAEENFSAGHSPAPSSSQQAWGVWATAPGALSLLQSGVTESRV